MTLSYYKTKPAGYREIQTRFHKDVTNFSCYLTQFYTFTSRFQKGAKQHQQRKRNAPLQ